jgi:AraC-like DNA-binding protein
MLINQFLAKARFRSTEFGLVSYEADFRGFVAVTGRPKIYAMRQGKCWLQLDGEPAVRLHAGDMALIVCAPSYHIYSDANAPEINVMELIRQRPPDTYKLEMGKTVSTQFFATQCVWDDVARETVARMLPNLIVVRGDEFDDRAVVDMVLDLIVHEIDRARPTSPIVVNRLANMLLCEMLLAKYSRDEAREALLSAIGKPGVARALMLIHASLIPDFTVDDLARRVAMSRSALTTEFVTTVGLPPGRYLIEVKLRRAAALLTTTDYGISTVADMVGYESTPSFIKAFRQRYGRSPNRYRGEGGTIQ